MSIEQPTRTIRLATPDDIPLITFHRRAMFEDMGITDRAALDTMDERFANWMRGKIERGEYRGWFVTDEKGAVLAGAGLWLLDNLPSPRDPASARRGFVINVYTRPEHRRHGHARQLMDVVLDWCRDQGIHTVALHASDACKALYESLGFCQTTEMQISLSPPA